MNAAFWFADLRYSLRHPWVRIGLWAAGAALGLMIVALAVWWPARISQQRLEDQIAAKRRDLVQAQQAEELLHAYVRASKEVVVFEKKLEYAATQSQLVENLARLSRKHSVKIISETYEEGRTPGTQPTLNTELAVQGNYPALRDFLRELSALPTWSEVQEVRFESERSTGLLKGRIRVVTYRGMSAERPKAL